MTDKSAQDDLVANFQIDATPVRGRIARLGADSLAPILDRHDYPTELARLLGEAVTLAALVGSSLKFKGRLLIQAEGSGAVTMLVGEYSTGGGLRGYARYDEALWNNLERINKGGRPHMPQLFGSGALALIMIQDDRPQQPYQGVVPLVRGSLADCAEDYFAQSEQLPTKVSLSVAEHSVGGAKAQWRSGGMLLQKIAGDDARGDTQEDWNAAQAIFGTLTDGELADPDLSADGLLFRLFHETGVRIEERTGLSDKCACNAERLRTTLEQMPDSELVDIAEGDETLGIDCQFCNRHYDIPLTDLLSKD